MAGVTGVAGGKQAHGELLPSSELSASCVNDHEVNTHNSECRVGSEVFRELAENTHAGGKPRPIAVPDSVTHGPHASRAHSPRATAYATLTVGPGQAATPDQLRCSCACK